MNQYLIFAGDSYYPAGGWEDCRGSMENLEAAKLYALALKKDWVQIVDTNTQRIVWTNSN